MKEIGKPTYESDDYVALSADNQAVLMRELKEEIQALHMLHGMVGKGDALQRELFRNVFYVSESRLANMCKLTGVELDTVAERKARSADILAVNTRNRDLERQLGLTGTPEQTAAHLKVLAAKLSKWWRCDGFGHVREVSFSQNGQVKAELSCHLFGDFPVLNSATPVSDKERKAQWLTSLTERGFILHEEKGEHEPGIVDCDSSRKALLETITKAMPSAKVWSTENHCGRSGTMTLKSVHIWVSNLADLNELKPTSGFTTEER
jgi:hypothetical protein